jgi:hypothetical protein
MHLKASVVTNASGFLPRSESVTKCFHASATASAMRSARVCGQVTRRNANRAWARNRGNCARNNSVTTFASVVLISRLTDVTVVGTGGLLCERPTHAGAAPRGCEGSPGTTPGGG